MEGERRPTDVPSGFRSEVFVTAEEREIARRALETPDLECPDFLDVLVDMLLEKNAMGLKLPLERWNYLEKFGASAFPMVQCFQRMKARIVARSELGKGTGRTTREIRRAEAWAFREQGLRGRQRLAEYLAPSHVCQSSIHRSNLVKTRPYEAGSSIETCYRAYVANINWVPATGRRIGLSEMNSNGFFVDHYVEELEDLREIDDALRGVPAPGI